MQTISNKKAFHNFEVLEKLEAGIVLSGTEVKSIRQGKVSLVDSYVIIDKGEAYTWNMHISPYDHGNRYNLDPMRPRKLLLHTDEIKRLMGKIKEKGLSAIVLNLHWKKNKVKVEIGLARGKKLYDKRADLKKKAVTREIEQALKNR